VDESASIRGRLEELGASYLSSPVSGNGKCVKAGKLSAVVSGDEQAFERAKPFIETVAGNGVSYVGEGELARICKIAHNVFLGVVIQNLSEITVLAEKAGVSRQAFLAFINNSVMGSIFTRYKSPALVNLDWTTTFTPTLLRKDLDLGLGLGRSLEVPMPVTATTREQLQAHIGEAQFSGDAEAFLGKDFSALIETVARGAGMTLKSENKKVPTGLES
jgi:3-hydroxyisobutyrate dehydrogenase